MAVLTDFRYPGGTSASVAEEIRAQAAAGLSTALVHVPSPYLRSVRSFNPRIVDCLRENSADLAIRGETVSARVLVIRQPRIFASDLHTVPQIEADEVVMVINQSPQDLARNRLYYDIDDVRRRVEKYFGDRVHWVTIGPLVRRELLAASPAFPLSPTDWHNIIDVDDWRTSRSRPVGEVPVIGRHSRPDPGKWPLTAEEILQAYPSAEDFKVRVLGGGDFAVTRIGYVPDSWELLPFGSMRPQEFLQTIDYFVYFHDPHLVEAFGRTVLEAMASGVPVVIPESFRELFGDAALYAKPDEVKSVVRELHANWHRYQEISRRAQAFADERFGYRSHVLRLRELGVETPVAAPSAESEEPNERRTPRSAGTRIHFRRSGAGRASARRIMMLSSNGAGLGHLTRLMAIARRLPRDLQAVIATQSYAASVVQQAGYLTEYIPSRGHLDITAKRWNEFLHDRLLCLLAVHEPRVVAVDGTVPYEGLLGAMADRPDITWVWVRRAMWKRDQGNRWIERGRAFDVVLEPGEFAAECDDGPTVAERGGVKGVGPITYLDVDELVDGESARRALGLNEGPAALLQLGAGNINDISTTVGRMARYLGDQGFQVILAESPIATRAVYAPPGVRIAKHYPLSRYLRGFDLAISAAGYNSFHELIAYAVPTVFVPNGQTALDDQVARARHAAAVGAGLALYDPSGSEMEQVLSRAAKPDVRARLAERCTQLAIANGATEAAAWLNALSSDAVGKA